MAETNGSNRRNDVSVNIIDRALAPVIQRAVVRELGERGEIASELIGRYTMAAQAQVSLFKSRSRVKSVDETIPDYEFWDRLRRGKAKGYTLGGLFAPRIEEVFSSWVVGRGVMVQLKESGDPDNPEDPRNYTDGRLEEFIDSLLEEPETDDDVEPPNSPLDQLYRDMLGLGDQYIIVNMDGSISIPSPDTVAVERSGTDYRHVLSVEVETKTGEFTIVDRYEATTRTVTIKKGAEIQNELVFQNLIGRIPVVHLAYGRSGNETNGHPIHEALRPLYDQYDDTIYKQLDGAKLLGNPIPTFEGMEDINSAITQNDPQTQDTYTDKDGNTETRTQVMLDDNAVIFVGKGGRFHFAAPPTGFTQDTKTALKTLFLLLLDHTGIPEFIWGNELTSSRSSSETQLTQWVRDIEKRQKRAAGWLRRLCKIWLMIEALTDSRIVVDKLTVSWPPLVQEDEEIRLKFLQFGKLAGLLTDKTALALLNLVDNPGREVEEAKAEADARREEMFPDGDSAAFQARLNQDDEENDDE